ncbi:hypothetical protein BR1R3_50700 [Pseudomonas atacamensis]|nr:hypothetical protein BR1R3_50700 [Pseudomonas atacamensis]
MNAADADPILWSNLQKIEIPDWSVTKRVKQRTAQSQPDGRLNGELWI